MTLNEYQGCQRGDKLYFARIMPKFGYYEIHDVVVVQAYEDHILVCETKTKQSFIFNVNENGVEALFLSYLKQKKKENKDVKKYVIED